MPQQCRAHPRLPNPKGQALAVSAYSRSNLISIIIIFNLNAIKKLISLSHVVDHSLRPREEEVKQLGGVPDGQEGGGC